MSKEAFLVYKSFYEPIKALSTEDKGLLLTAIFEYKINEKEIDLPVGAKMAFQFFKNQFRLDDNKYSKIVEIRREAGKQGGLAKATKVKQKLPKHSKATYNEKEKDNEKDNVLFVENPQKQINPFLRAKTDRQKFALFYIRNFCEDTFNGANDKSCGAWFQQNTKVLTNVFNLCNQDLHKACCIIIQADYYFDKANCTNWGLNAVGRNFDLILADMVKFKTMNKHKIDFEQGIIKEK